MAHAVPFLLVRSRADVRLPDHERFAEAGCVAIERGEHLLVTNARGLEEARLLGHAFNCEVLQDIMDAEVLKAPSTSPSTGDLPAGSNALTKTVNFAQHLRGEPEQHQRAAANAHAVGGVRNPKRSLGEGP